MERKKRVLLVDDDADAVIAVEAILQGAGYEVVAAYSAREALTLLPGAEFDVALLDMMMEENDSGIQVAREIRRNPGTENVPILLLTAVASRTGFRVPLQTEEERAWLQADVWLDKPVTPEQLLTALARVEHD